MIGPGVPPPMDMDPWGTGGEPGDGIPEMMAPETAAMWRERERRQRSVRFLMMFLLMLLLMDGEEQQQRRQNNGNNNFNSLRKRSSRSSLIPRRYLERSVYQARQTLEERLRALTTSHPRYDQLVQKNNGENVQRHIRQWAEQRAELEKDEFVMGPQENNNKNNQMIMVPTSKEQVPTDPELQRKVWHYPWNATGFYRGEWIGQDLGGEEDGAPEASVESTRTEAVIRAILATADGTKTASDKQDATKKSKRRMNAIEVESEMVNVLQDRQESFGVFLLPKGMELRLGNATPASDSNFRSPGAEDQLPTSHQSVFLRGTRPADTLYGWPQPPPSSMLLPDETTSSPKITLTKSSGRAAFQLYARSVPSIQELSLLDGFVKLYDSNTVGYSTRRDILLRVSGVFIHAVGRMSLVSNSSPGRSALVVERVEGETGKPNNDGKSHIANAIPATVDQNKEAAQEIEIRRRLQEAVASQTSKQDVDGIRRIREDSLSLFPYLFDEKLGSSKDGWTLLTSVNSDEDEDLFWPLLGADSLPHRRLSSQENIDSGSAPLFEANTDTPKSSFQVELASNAARAQTSNVVLPYPYVPDDKEQTIRRTRTPAARRMPPREQLLEANAGSCEFEINMNVQEEEWTVGEWRTLVSRHLRQAFLLNPALYLKDGADDGTNAEESSGKGKNVATNSAQTPPMRMRPRKAIQDQALVMTMNGTIYSPNCNFKAAVNATAIRTDWEHTTGKAINYSFYMMLTCLTQIVLLLRQLLHTQSQSAATRVSLLCIGWQTVLDALLCLVHIYLSLAMQPLFTAFASVAFFKLLIFCVIEMKYMAIIMQARNSSNGGNTMELLRRQIAMLHLRFYVALIGTFLAFFYAGEAYRTVYVLALYSFWVPQIVQNVITEAKRPMHTYYIYGMSLTRLVAPLYIFAVPNNFLKEVYPDSPTNVFMCELLFVWVAIQTAVLVGQGHYGARFMIPQRFLPPKFDYSRPIPPSLLPPGALDESPSESLHNERASESTERQPLRPSDSSTRRTTGVARNRLKGSRPKRSETGMTAETVTPPPPDPSRPCIDCVICYNAIDVRNRTGYMLAPCDHLFHKDCLVQWMDVKMECPICRTALPAL
jgi:transmembrane E3 ubiquitin-protein ligase